MEKTYVIGWKSRNEPRFGQGKKLFTREEAEQLAAELNEDYPAFLHEPVNLDPAEPAILGVQPGPEQVAEPATTIIEFSTMVQNTASAAATSVEEPLAVNL